jgi:hypothetical protein
MSILMLKLSEVTAKEEENKVSANGINTQGFYI